MIIETGLAVIFAAAAMRSVYKLDPGQSGVKMFLGKIGAFNNTPGPHLKAPWESVRKLETKQKFKDPVLKNVKTDDGYIVDLPLQIQYKIADPGKYLFAADNPDHQMEILIENSVRAQVAKMKFNELYTSKDALEQNIEAHEKAALKDKFGIELVGVVPGDPQPDAAVLAAINERIRQIEAAKGNKEAAVLEGEGIAAKRAAVFAKYPDQIKALTEANMPVENAEALVALSMAFDTVRDAAMHGNTILTTSDPAAVLGQYAAIAKKFTGSVAAGPAAGAPKAPEPTPVS